MKYTKSLYIYKYIYIYIYCNDETLEQVNQFTYLGCSITYQFSNDVEFKLAKFYN